MFCLYALRPGVESGTSTEGSPLGGGNHLGRGTTYLQDLVSRQSRPKGAVMSLSLLRRSSARSHEEPGGMLPAPEPVRPAQPRWPAAVIFTVAAGMERGCSLAATTPRSPWESSPGRASPPPALPPGWRARNPATASQRPESIRAHHAQGGAAGKAASYHHRAAGRARW